MLAYWNGDNSQYVVGQATETDVVIVVSGAPDGAQVHEINLSGVKALRRQNGVGGTHITLPEIEHVRVDPDHH